MKFPTLKIDSDLEARAQTALNISIEATYVPI